MQPLDLRLAQRDLSFSGYIASGEEVTAGEADYSEIFTVCPDIPVTDTRVAEAWPCHGPVPWPDEDYRTAMKNYLREVGEIGEKLLKLIDHLNEHDDVQNVYANFEISDALLKKMGG